MKILRTIIASFLLAGIAIAAHADSFPLGIDGEESTSVGLYIKDLRTGTVVLDHNSQLALTPASVMKAVTTATALSVNGHKGRFSTRVALRGTRTGKTFKGDIVVHASADPTLESENFKSRLGFCDSIVAAVRSRGITAIQGRIVLEESLKDAGPILQWEIEDVAWGYGAGLFGFNWRDNTFTLHPATKEMKPEIPGLKITVRKSTTGNDLIRGVYSDHLLVYARDPSNKKWAVTTTMPDPGATFALELAKKLKEAGITYTETAKPLPATTSETTIHTHRSATYGEIMRSLMVRSDNLFAEGILRSIEPGADRKTAIKREKELWATRGINPRYTIINDGSGLTRANRLSARFIGDVLEWMAKSPEAETYTSFFPRAGKEGTMRGFLAKSPLKGQIALKTGSVSSVQCYAGYKFDNDGRPTHVVVILVNGFFCPRRQVREAAERLLTQTFIPETK